MIKDNQKRLNRMHVLLDILVTVVAYALAWFIVISGKVLPLDEGVLKPQVYFMALIFIVPIYLILYASFHLYVPKRIQGRRSELANICKANVIGLMVFTFVLFGLRRFVSHLSYFSTKMILAFFAANIILLEAERISIRIFLRSLRTNGYNQKHVLLIGYSRAAEGFIDRVSVNPEWGYHVQGILDDHRPAGFVYKKVQVLGPTNHLEDFLASNTLDEIAITLSIKEYSNLEQIVAACEKSGVHTKFIPDYNNIIPTIPYMEDLQGLPVIHIRHVPLTGVFNATMKRIVDLAGALFGLIVFSPLMLVTALLIKITSPGPVLFSQERIGLHNRPFKMYKFRSMEVQDPGRERSQWTTPHDPRVTPVGRFIRKTSIDEMPQFFNVLIGDMSLVGPRPERPLFVEKFKEEIPRYMIKHQVRPGLTGWAQVNGYRGDTSITKRIEHDLYYIENWSLGFDFKIMLLTVFKGFINKNAY
ncbi:undecaprenyl-phosphate glucose phosphotransferase [Enterocloster clostridioformis]|uniref:undecaprenyl-phosphate glucose phosphotransferase n=1 Tax=Enterocloster clostridioformis TaxID=1531 RepID=UPI00080C933D|nr:undecaprenyl-phosphate glucose phosphotransferase [Enterocloster clostridioformis]ANU48073.1 undecaprenyl-phosphate glucose phosphotransferase [Lachnoclostridium sp. YL32]NDO29634.1 undecaprenyl-phosphate glucose phosphotransferase [Enterocloster clostridioformis]OXE69215.1 undecaprenyl-phosphate glucose phosphotransferase [Enterocloster clostridioformis]QQR03034.1 undecaprenyl-phosphate glucose phosphotransferase [Enterocloster clostridioformis]